MMLAVTTPIPVCSKCRSLAEMKIIYPWPQTIGEILDNKRKRRRIYFWCPGCALNFLGNQEGLKRMFFAHVQSGSREERIVDAMLGGARGGVDP